MLRLHLGCGRKYIDGYVNIDYPPSEHSVQSDIQADIRIDLLDLRYDASSVDEIRLHHVFEHFSRSVALALLCRWRNWLKPGGILRIETPDLLASAWLIVSPFVGRDQKQEVVRHLFGSHEAHWAAHWDGWYGDRFISTLSALGFVEIKLKKTKWGRLRNIEAIAMKSARVFAYEDLRNIVQQLLSKSLVKYSVKKRLAPSVHVIGESEQAMLQVWMSDWERINKNT